jgi:hypothetical protein
MNTASTDVSILDLRRRVLLALPSRSDALVNLIDCLTVGPRLLTPSELALCPPGGFESSSFYSALRAAAGQRTVDRLRRARLWWWEHFADQLDEPSARTGPWRVRVLDWTGYERPRTKTVRLGYVHTAGGMKPGHCLSLLSQRVADGSWFLPVSIDVVDPTQAPTAAGVAQVLAYVRHSGWPPDDILAVDAAYTNEPTLRPLLEAAVNVLGRISSKRVLYRPPPPYRGRGRPRLRGRKIKLSDERTLPEADAFERVELPCGGWLEISQYRDVRLRTWPTQPLVLYRIWEYTAAGKRKYPRPLWLIYVGQSDSPTPAQAESVYDHRFGIEHSLRFMKRELTLDKAQFNGEQAQPRVALWVELVATVVWMLFALRHTAKSEQVNWPKGWRGRRLTPGAVRRVAMGLFLKLGIQRANPHLRGKSPGRAVGVRLEPRKRYRIYRKRANRAPP